MTIHTLFETLENMIVQTADGVRPPERLTVSQAAEKYRKLNNPGAYVGPWLNSMAPYLVDVQDVLSSTMFTGMVFVGPAQCGKLLDLDTPIPTPTGWARFGDLAVGDIIFGIDGKPTTVTVLNPVKTDTDAFAIVFDDGETVYADATHDWCVNDMWSEDPRRLEKRTTAWLFERYVVPTKTGRRFRFSIPTTDPLELPEIDLPIDPYTLGVWLGDGTTKTGSLTLGNQDAAEIAGNIPGARMAGKGNSTGTATRVVVAGLRVQLETLRLTEGKHIPAAYLRASESQRRALLQGLMDTDGTQDYHGRAAFSASDESLARQVYELAVSLGFKVHRDDKVPGFQNGEGKRSYRLSFTPQDPAKVFRLSRHVARREEFTRTRTARPTHSERRFIRSIRRVESRPMRCIGVDHPQHLYLCGRGMIPTHNTDIFLNWQTHTVVCDPADMMLIQTSQTTARDFSIRRVDRLHRYTKEVGDRLIQRRDADNTYDKQYASGMLVTLSWPTINELSGKPIPRLWLTDYDRMTQDVDGEGSPFDLAKKRATTFGSHGMCAAESSPGFVVDNPKWMPSSKHEAPPTQGILSLYNRGDRRRWYWRCVECKTPFEPDFSLIHYPDSEDFMEAAEMATMKCPHCDMDYHHDPMDGMPGKYEMNKMGRWVKDGQFWMPDGSMEGRGIRSDIASFWLKGVAASFASWKTLVFNYLTASREWEQNGTEEALKTTVNTDQGMPYTPKSMASDRLPEQLKSRAKPLGQREVPPGVRFLSASIDVQKNRFVVQVHGTGVGKDVTVIDRFEIKKSKRVDEDGERLWVNPGAYPEDWKLLVEEVLLKSYPLMDGSGRRMGIKLTMCDSGGKEGVTANAYDFYRWLRVGDDPETAVIEQGDYKWEPGLATRFLLVKGASTKHAPRVAISFPDSQRKDRSAGARGEVPVLLMNTDLLKDTLDKMLDRTEPGGGRVNFPDWLDDNFFTELTVEVKDPNKGWLNPRKYRNESWDLLVYYLAGTLTKLVGLEHLNWEQPPGWAEEWDQNDLVFDPVEQEKPFASEAKRKSSLSSLADNLA